MSTAVLMATAVRWLGFLTLAGVIGSLVIDLFVWPLPGIATDADLRAWLRRWTLPCLLILTITTAVELVIRTQTMVRSDFMTALWATPAVLRQTHFGTLWIARFLALMLSMVMLVWASRPARMIMLLLALAVALTTSLTGHAGDWGPSFTAGNDWAHVVASAAWVGGLIYLALVARRIVVRDAASLSLVGRRFSRLAAVCLIAVLASGSYNAWVQVQTISTLWTTRYGHVLLVKLLFVLGLVCFGAVNRYVMLPSLGSASGRGFVTRAFRLGRLMMFGARRIPRSKAPSRFLAYISCEAVLGILVFGCTAVLVDSPPARHAAHAQHTPDEKHGSVRTTMAALHASGGIPKGWLFTPPPGDAAKGREIFTRLQCFACHAVGDENFPPTAGPGPELTDVGEHHPAGYLLESILNPNAVIVEGPGYTGADGKSIMPDYRGRLSVSELIDLVAYLESL